MIDPAALQMVLYVLTGWLDHREREAVGYLIEENRLLRASWGLGDCASPMTIADTWLRGGVPRGSACFARHRHDRDARHW